MSEVLVEYKGDKFFEVKVGNHTMKVDLPKIVGGKDRAPTPTELCAVSLASCIAAVTTLYCENAKLDTQGLTVRMNYEKLDNPSRLGKFRTTIKLPAAEVGNRKEAILRVAHACPVHETIRLHEGIDIVVEG